MTALPVLYSFRRCPYAMRARMALMTSGQQCELREVVLREKPDEFLAISPSATVPALATSDGIVLDESLDIMLWTLERHDPQNWLKPAIGNKSEMLALIERMDGPFKNHLDKYKYASRHTGDDSENFAIANRDAAMIDLAELDMKLQKHRFLFGDRLSLADIAIAPFVRQFANTDADWFAAQPFPALQKWLNAFVTSDLFLSVMKKYPQWQSGSPGIEFPEQRAA